MPAIVDNLKLPGYIKLSSALSKYIALFIGILIFMKISNLCVEHEKHLISGGLVVKAFNYTSKQKSLKTTVSKMICSKNMSL